jgi:hypothetical protein
MNAPRLSIDDVLETLGRADGNYTAICHKIPGGSSSSVVASGNASGVVTSLPEEADVWFSVNPTAGPARQCSGRGSERQVTRWAALHLDVDVKDCAFPDLDNGAAFVSTLSEMVGARPSVLIYSGHGLQPLWPIEGGELNTFEKWRRAYRLNRRFDRLARRVAGEFSVSLDMCRTWPEAMLCAGYKLDLYPWALPLCADLVDAGWIVLQEKDGVAVLRTELHPRDMREVLTITDAGKRQHELLCEEGDR